MRRCAANPAFASLQTRNRSRSLLRPVYSALLSRGPLRVCRKQVRQFRPGYHAPHTRSRRQPSRLHPALARLARSSFSQRQHQDSGHCFFLPLQFLQSNGRFSRQPHESAPCTRPLRNSRGTLIISSLQSPPPRRDRLFHAPTRDRRPASFGFRIWLRRYSRHATAETCARFPCNLRVERLCSEQELRLAFLVFSLQKCPIVFRTGLSLCVAY